MVHGETTPLLTSDPERATSGVIQEDAAAAEIQAGASQSPTRPGRIVGMDLLRGLLMVIMAIDHARDALSNIHIDHEQWYRMPHYNGNWYRFLLRFVTGWCAPGFFMLMGWGISFFVQSRLAQGWTWSRILLHFAIRGGILIVLNFLFFALPFALFFHTVWVSIVIFALGVNLFVGAFILYAETKLTSYYEAFTASITPRIVPPQKLFDVIIPFTYVVLTTVLACLPSWYTPKPSEVDAPYSFFWVFFFLPGETLVKGVFSIYPPFPWLAPTVIGIALGRCGSRLRLDAKRQALLSGFLGVFLLTVFVIVRISGGFGNINPELVVPPVRESLISFLNNVKYPPSVAFLSLTLGINLTILSGLLMVRTSWISQKNGVLMVFGGSALAFFLTHHHLYMAMGFLLKAVHVMPEGGFSSPLPFWTSYGSGLAIEYLFCRWYAEFKRGTAPDSVWRFF